MVALVMAHQAAFAALAVAVMDLVVELLPSVKANSLLSALWSAVEGALKGLKSPPAA